MCSPVQFSLFGFQVAPLGSSQIASVAAVALALFVSAPNPVSAADHYGLTPGPVELQSLGPITFAGKGVLLVGDPKAATVYAIAIAPDASATTNAAANPKDAAKLEIADIRRAIGDAVRSNGSDITIGDLAVDPDSGTIIVSAEGKGRRHLSRIRHDGTVQMINLSKVEHARKQLPNPPADKLTGEGRRQKNLRLESITDIAFFDGKVMVSGISADESPSNVMEFSFPFSDNSVVTNVQIYHAAHGRVEEPAIRTFIPMTIDGLPTLLAGFTCTPLVRFPIDSLGGKDTVRGTTVAELGNWNSPIDLIAYEKDGQTNLLMSNTARGVMKISTDQIQNAPGLTERVGGGGTAGQAFETIDAFDGVTQMDKFSDSQAIAIIGKEGETQKLVVMDLP
ncbi:hypothetical protein K227x_54050 [Rubripirellula lacrimiformis]|uniref:Uncharacterized protein n=1 Tax=Rubripirellula lacrimiformis TaxID=1930273 RepID=A0A517NIM0_9BACT|nr:hypothetical protein [Rubripirellula lacrimiformis]QDT06981.1 hypothetical protein K227x_54050 [Rubripirellula lacrimiformis]